MKDWFNNTMSNAALAAVLKDRTKQATGKELKLPAKTGRCTLARMLEDLDAPPNKLRVVQPA